MEGAKAGKTEGREGQSITGAYMRIIQYFNLDLLHLWLLFFYLSCNLPGCQDGGEGGDGQHQARELQARQHRGVGNRQ